MFFIFNFDVCNMNLWGQLSNVNLIVQDDVNDIGNKNFKIISWICLLYTSDAADE